MVWSYTVNFDSFMYTLAKKLFVIPISFNDDCKIKMMIQIFVALFRFHWVMRYMSQYIIIMITNYMSCTTTNCSKHHLRVSCVSSFHPSLSIYRYVLLCLSSAFGNSSASHVKSWNSYLVAFKFVLNKVEMRYQVMCNEYEAVSKNC